jgi:hypothetical protein
MLRKSSQLTNIASLLIEYVMFNLTIITIVPLYAHFLCRRLTLLTITTLLFSN